MNILLIGARASGKTTVGKLAAAQMLHSFVDLDDVALEMLEAKTISDAWQKLGETAWRDAESRAFELVARETGQVIALGGGAPMITSVRERIQVERRAKRALVFYLECPPEILAERLRKDSGDRPSLTGADPADEVAEVLLSREATYRALADEIVQTGEVSPDTAAAKISHIAHDFAQRKRK